MAIVKNAPVEIIPVENGFMIRPQISHSEYSVPDNIIVCQSMAELHGWLDGHFDFRQPDDILADKETGS